MFVSVKLKVNVKTPKKYERELEEELNKRELAGTSVNRQIRYPLQILSFCV